MRIFLTAIQERELTSTFDFLFVFVLSYFVLYVIFFLITYYYLNIFNSRKAGISSLHLTDKMTFFMLTSLKYMPINTLQVSCICIE